MFQAYSTTSTTYAQNETIKFSTVKSADRRIVPSNGMSFALRAPGRYLVSFYGVGASTQATSPFSVALTQNGTVLPETASTITSVASGDAGTLSCSTIVNVEPRCGCFADRITSVGVVATSTNSGTLASANLIVLKVG